MYNVATADLTASQDSVSEQRSFCQTAPNGVGLGVFLRMYVQGNNILSRGGNAFKIAFAFI